MPKVSPDVRKLVRDVMGLSVVDVEQLREKVINSNYTT